MIWQHMRMNEFFRAQNNFTFTKLFHASTHARIRFSMHTRNRGCILIIIWRQRTEVHSKKWKVVYYKWELIYMYRCKLTRSHYTSNTCHFIVVNIYEYIFIVCRSFCDSMRVNGSVILFRTREIGVCKHLMWINCQVHRKCQNSC